MGEPNPKCELCTAPLESAAQIAMRACQRCATTIGLVPMPGVRRPPLPCGRCNARRFVRVIPREHSAVSSGTFKTRASAPMFATTVPRVDKSLFDGTRPSLQLEADGVGLLEMYICEKCGFVEWYCVDPERIPLHPNTMTDLVDYDQTPEPPYR